MSRSISKRLNAWALTTALLAVISATAATGSSHCHYLPKDEADLQDFNAQQLGLAARRIMKRKAGEAYAAYHGKCEDPDRSFDNILVKWGEVVDRPAVHLPTKTLLSQLTEPDDARKNIGENTDAAPNSHWSFQPLHKPVSPAISSTRWSSNEIDYFILKGLGNGPFRRAHAIDLPIAGLLEDLDRWGLLGCTLVIWGGEFGRSSTSQDGDGGDHNPHRFGMWIASNGVKAGTQYGALDELGYKPIEVPVSMADLHVTILYMLGLNPGYLIYHCDSREKSLTNGLGIPIKEVLA